ncbi:MAG: DUF4292 domain-containing protein [Firmicutes bacterium]|nr:DUF4292 domain-containing protein [Bacillota bacterium]
MWIAVVAGLAIACSVRTRRVATPEATLPARNATREDLIQEFNRQAEAVHSLTARIELQATVGSAYRGLIEEYREVGGFLLAQRPSSIRVIGQAPVVGKNLFDMVSDAQTFRIFIPSRNQFLVGAAVAPATSEKPIENLRPQHLLDALFWQKLTDPGRVLLEEFDAPPSRYYVLTELRPASADAGWEIARKLWFERTDLSLVRLQYFGAAGRRLADIRYAEWRTVAGVRFPHRILLERPQEDYQLTLGLNRPRLNETIAAERFRLEPPPGTKLVRVGDRHGEADR